MPIDDSGGDGHVSAFSEAEIDYLQDQRRATLATIGQDGQPHMVPVTFHYNADEDAIDVGGVNFGDTKKWRDANANPKVTLLIEDVLSNPRRARALEVRGEADIHETGGETINPDIPGFAPEFIRIRPRRIVSWGLEEGGVGAEAMRTNARTIRRAS